MKEVALIHSPCTCCKGSGITQDDVKCTKCKGTGTQTVIFIHIKRG